MSRVVAGVSCAALQLLEEAGCEAPRLLDDAAGRREMIDYWKGRDAQASTQNLIANLVRGAGTIGVLVS